MLTYKHLDIYLKNNYIYIQAFYIWSEYYADKLYEPVNSVNHLRSEITIVNYPYNRLYQNDRFFEYV